MSATSRRVAPQALVAHTSSRVERLKASHSYGFVLALIIAAFVFSATAPDESWATSVLVVLLSVTLVCALWTSGLTPFGSRWRAGLVAVSVAAAVANVAPGGRVASGSVSLFAGALALAIIIAIGVGVVDQGEVNSHSVSGAVGVYVLLGLFFVFLYGAVAKFGSSPFFTEGTDGTRAIRTYFSYVTLATVGYGDYTAASTIGHTLSVVEALTGQLYLVTVIALLVSRLRPRSRGEQ